MKKRIWFICLILAIGSAALTGCARQRYRVSADREVYDLLGAVDQQDPLWKVENFTLEQNCGSRYSDFHDPDRQPMPQDDAAAQRLMHEVEGMRGWRKWWDNGWTDTVENEAWRQTLPVNEKGEVVIDQDAAFDLALLHSPEYRTAMENLYLAALDVTAERYVFDVKFYGGDSLFFNNYGGLKKGSVSTLENDFGGGHYGTGSPFLSKHFATGADVVVGIANSLVWSFSPENQTFTPITELSYNITQPLLRGAGRAVALESLTRSERRLLANVRQLALFQQGFYVSVLTGSNPIAAPAEGGYPGRFTGSAAVGNGYYALLRDQVQIRNEQQHIESLKDNLNQYEEYFKAGRLPNSYQVEQVRQTLLAGQSQLVSQKDRYRNSIESYLIKIGLPPDIRNVVIEDKLLDRFTLMSPTLTSIYEKVNEKLRDIRNETIPMPGGIADTLGEFKESVAQGLAEIEDDLVRLDGATASRKESMTNLSRKLRREHPELDSSFCDADRFDAKIALIKSDLEDAREGMEDILRLMDATIGEIPPQRLAEMITETSAQPSRSPFSPETIGLIKKLQLEDFFEDNDTANEAKMREELGDDPVLAEILEREERRSGNAPKYDIDEPYRKWVGACFDEFAERLITLRLVQTRARLETVELPIIDIDEDEAFAVAREHRLDWMNARSELVDVWRNIEITANALRAALDLELGGSVTSNGSNPLKFSSNDVRTSASVRFDAPLDRLAERNAYRRALISYDRARRNYYTYVDSVKLQIRDMIRNIYRNQMELELKRESVRVATVQVHLAQLDLANPAKASSMSTSSARDLVEALNALLTSQNSFMSTWLDYQVQRMSLLLQLGLFEIDAEGKWVDPGPIDREFLARAAEGEFLSQDALFGMDRLGDVSTIISETNADLPPVDIPAPPDETLPAVEAPSSGE
ncbi:MAG: TolC family protein [Thermoguttaceae bacterium]|nr:TolC family protein [Thermoguttaceae bacterium]